MRNSGKFGNIFIALLIAASFAIAGCGGGGGTAAVEEPPMEMPEPTAQEICEGDGGRYNADGSCTSAADVAAEMAAAEAEATALSDAQDAAMAAFTAAMAAVYGAKDPVARDNAHVHAMAAGTANAAAQAATTSADAMTHQMAAETASASAVEAGMTRGLGSTTTANANANQSAIDSAALVGTPPPAPVSNAGRVSVAITQAASAVAAESPAVIIGDNTPEAGNPSTLETTVQMGRHPRADSPPDIILTATARHTGTAPRFTVLPEITDIADAEEEDQVLGRGEIPTALVMSGEKPGGGWEGAELVSTVSGAEGHKEYAVVYTDIAPPAQTYNADGAINLRDLDGENGLLAQDDPGNTAVNRAVVTVTGEVPIPGDGSHFEATYNANPADNAPPRPGRFFCAADIATSTGCSISVDDVGVVRAIQGYVFQPAVPGDVKRGDSDYLAWGYWLHVPNAAASLDATDNPENYATVAAFATGNAVFNVTKTLTGTATYTGVAHGLYSADRMIEYFEADASLTADFGGHRSGNDSTPATPATDNGLLGAVSGSITNITAGGIDVDGSLTLGRAPLTAGNINAIDADSITALATAVTDDDPATRFSGNTAGTLGSRTMTGSWSGRFYGKNNAPGGSLAARTEYPTTAAGTFGAATTRGTGPGVSILGAFGAWKDEVVVAE